MMSKKMEKERDGDQDRYPFHVSLCIKDDAPGVVRGISRCFLAEKRSRKMQIMYKGSKEDKKSHKYALGIQAVLC